MKTKRLVLYLIIFTFCAHFSCEKEDPSIKVTSVSVSENSMVVTEGYNNKLQITISPEKATNKKVTWRSSNPSVVFVDKNGEIVANKAGSATITVTTEDGKKTATCNVTVEPKTIAITSILLNIESIEIVEGGTKLLTYAVEPTNATNKNVRWESSDISIVSVDQNGKITANKTGDAAINAVSELGNITATCSVSVVEKDNLDTSISLNKIKLSLLEGESEKLIANITPSNAPQKNIDWTSSDESIATVNSDGKVAAVKAGVALITATDRESGKKDFCSILVEQKIVAVTEVTLDKKSLTLIKGESDTLTAEVIPSDATNKKLIWKSDNPEIASVDSNGKITAHEIGSTVITTTTEDGDKTAQCEVNVEVISVTSVTLKTSLTIDVGESETLIPTIEPTNASNKIVSWKSANKNIATVDSKGKVYGVNEGNTTITVTTDDGDKTAVCDVVVTKSWISLSNQGFHTSGAGETFNVNLDASDSWSISSKPHWITVTTSGNMGVSSVEISVSSYNGSAVYRTGEIVFKLDGRERTATLTVDQYNFPYVDGDYVKVQSSTRGDGIDLVFLGDGYTIEDIGRGTFRNNLNDAVEHFFDIEPYRSYREYFDVYIVYAFSEESGISDHITNKNTKFSSRYQNPNTTRMTTNNAKCFEYALKVPLSSDLSETLITVITNSPRYAGTNWSYSDGRAISVVPVSTLSYPFSFKNILQHEAGGHGFGKLADEYVNNFTTITTSDQEELRWWQQYGFYLNVDLTNNLNEILWKHFIGEPNYSYVGAHEGGYLYAYGVWRPEETSLMINNITYINAPSRELIVRRIKRLAGETFSFSEFKQKDVRETHSLTRSASITVDSEMMLPPPILIKVK